VKDSLVSVFLEKVADVIFANQDIEIAFLPNKRSCRELKKYLLHKSNTFLPQLVAVSDLISFDDQKNIFLIMKMLYNKNIPFNTLYELVESLCSFLKDLSAHRIKTEQLEELIPESMRRHWDHTIAIINAASNIPEIKKDLEQRKLELFLESIKNRKIITVGIGKVNRYTQLLLELAAKNGIIADHQIENSDQICEFLEFDSVFDEGFGIAVSVRKAIAEGQSVLIVSLNQNLTKIIKSELRRWNIFADDSEGTPFCQTPDGMLASLVMDMLEKKYECTSTLNVLKMSPEFQEIAFKIELFFRKQQTVPRNFFSAFELIAEKNEKCVALLEKIKVDTMESRVFHEWFDICSFVVSLINEESAKKLRGIAAKFLQYSYFDEKITLEDFSVFFKKYILTQSLRTARGYTPNVAIMGAIEAQLLDADFIVIADANEGSWHQSSGRNDLWMTKSMMKHLGIPTAEEQNRFLQNIFERLTSKKNVLITRSTQIDGIQQQRYTYLDKLQDRIMEVSQLKMLLSSIRRLNKKETISFVPPNPKLSVRPLRYWVSDLDLLISNPYAFYAKKILKLSEMNYINELKNIRGNFVHKILEEYSKDSKKELHKISENILKTKWLQPSDFGLWYFRLKNIFSFITQNTNNKVCHPEISGSYVMKISEDSQVELNCKADRIDVDDQGNISIIDYKTGQVPAASQVLSGKKIQLPVELVIARGDGFGLSKTSVESICFWHISGSGEGGEVKYIANNPEKIDQLAENTMTILKDLIYRYNIAGEAYNVNIYSPYEEAYMHLARVKEWRE